MKPQQIIDLHTHTTFCDGKNSVAEMITAAKAAGHSGIGFSGHSYAPFDPTCLGVQNEEGYITEIRQAQKAEQCSCGRVDRRRQSGDHKGDPVPQMSIGKSGHSESEGGFTILCGVEQDYYAPVADSSRYDYVIGSVHYIKPSLSDGASGSAQTDESAKPPESPLIAIDNPDIDLREVCNVHYGGNGLALAQEFYATVLDNITQYQPTIIGHFDLITKLNDRYKLFDEFGSAYQALAKDSMREACRLATGYGGIFEVNTGGISRGYRSESYPASYLLKEVSAEARVMLTSDSHSTSTLGYRFAQEYELLKSYGFKHVVVFCGGESATAGKTDSGTLGALGGFREVEL